jgi:hypothetical protein
MIERITIGDNYALLTGVTGPMTQNYPAYEKKTKEKTGLIPQ